MRVPLAWINSRWPMVAGRVRSSLTRPVARVLDEHPPRLRPQDITYLCARYGRFATLRDSWCGAPCHDAENKPPAAVVSLDSRRLTKHLWIGGSAAERPGCLDPRGQKPAQELPAAATVMVAQRTLPDGRRVANHACWTRPRLARPVFNEIAPRSVPHDRRPPASSADGRVSFRLLPTYQWHHSPPPARTRARGTARHITVYSYRSPIAPRQGHFHA